MYNSNRRVLNKIYKIYRLTIIINFRFAIVELIRSIKKSLPTHFPSGGTVVYYFVLFRIVRIII